MLTKFQLDLYFIVKHSSFLQEKDSLTIFFKSVHGDSHLKRIKRNNCPEQSLSEVDSISHFDAPRDFKTRFPSTRETGVLFPNALGEIHISGLAWSLESLNNVKYPRSNGCQSLNVLREERGL